jgi:hypothetical protein
MVSDEVLLAVRELLHAQPEREFFYVIYRTYSTGSTGDSSFHSLATDQQTCQETIQRLCAEQKAASAAIIAELNQLPEDERPYDPAIPDGCSVGLYGVLPDKAHVVLMHGQQWYNNGVTHHSKLIPDIFDVAYYVDKVRHGEYSRLKVVAVRR